MIRLAETGGAEEITLTVNQIAAHGHPMLASNAAAGQKGPAGGLLAIAQGDVYASGFTASAMSPQSIAGTGGSQPHTNFQPYLCVNYIISLFGIFPSPT